MLPARESFKAKDTNWKWGDRKGYFMQMEMTTKQRLNERQERVPYNDKKRSVQEEDIYCLTYTSPIQ